MRAAMVSAAIACVLAPGLARPSEVPVTYMVEQGPLRGAVAGTMVTFALHSDPACTSVVHEDVVPIEAVALIERVRAQRVRGAPAPPRVARLHHVLSGVPVAAAHFLTVTGTGVTPVGGACQPQLVLQPAVLSCATQIGTDVFFRGCNVHVQNGAGATDVPNGLGNLIVGYNVPGVGDRTGSHNVVVGDLHAYDSVAGLVAGYGNHVGAPYAAVTGGTFNEVLSPYGSVSGETLNVAVGRAAAVNGGSNNRAVGEETTVNGGGRNEAFGDGGAIAGGLDNATFAPYASIGGGEHNRVDAIAGSVAGGMCNSAGSFASELCVGGTAAPAVSGGAFNSAVGFWGTVSGGSLNTAQGTYAAVSGGFNNTAFGDASSVSGGRSNHTVAEASTVGGGEGSLAAGEASWIGGGQGHITFGAWSSVCGGQDARVRGDYASVGGGQGRSTSGPHDWAAGGLFEDF